MAEEITNGKIRRTIEKKYNGQSAANGKTTMILVCPFCGSEVEAYVWSLHGSGKKCPCGVLLTSHVAIKKAGKVS